MAYEVTFYWGEERFTNIIASGMSEAGLREFYQKKNYDNVEVRKISAQEHEMAAQSGKPVIEIDLP